MYIFIHKNILQQYNDKIRLLRHSNIMFDVLRITTLQLKNVHDLSYDQ
jgi:hypothetical protein